MERSSQPIVYGLIAEFATPDALLQAAKRAHAEGYRDVEAYSPLPIHGLCEALGFRSTRLPWLVFAGGVVGCLAGFGLQYWVSTVAYPLNIGGKPLNSWPAFVPVMFELTILFAALCAVFGMLALNGLPMLHHPIFNAKRFDLATTDRFFLCVEASDPKFDRAATARFLESLGAEGVSEVDA